MHVAALSCSTLRDRAVGAILDRGSGADDMFRGVTRRGKNAPRIALESSGSALQLLRSGWWDSFAPRSESHAL